MSKLFFFRYNSDSLRFGPMPLQFQNIMFVPMKASVRFLSLETGGMSYLKGLGCLGTALLVELGG